MTTRYYACSWIYGVASRDDGRRAAEYVSFGSSTARNAWVAGGPSYRTDRGYREVIRSGDADLRAALRQGLIINDHTEMP